MININAHISIEDTQSRAVLTELRSLKEAVMKQSEKLAAMAAALDAATNEIAKDLEALREKIADGTVSDEDLSPLDKSITRLQALGADAENPVPPVVD